MRRQKGGKGQGKGNTALLWGNNVKLRFTTQRMPALGGPKGKREGNVAGMAVIGYRGS